MKKFESTNFDNWKKINSHKRLNAYDYIVECMKNSNSDLYFAFLELFWPTFTQIENYIFVLENLKQRKIEEVYRLERDRHNIEYWINLTIVNEFFDANVDCVEKSTRFLDVLSNSWDAKLKANFPHKNFIIELVKDEEDDDFWITFYQKETK